MAEATGVSPEGRISLGDLGLWNDQQTEAFARIAAFIASQGAVPAIQLAHAGRKASTHVPWAGGAPLTAEQGAWEPIGPSPIPFAPGHPVPREMTLADIEQVVEQFAAAAQRALRAGFQVLEIHAAHGYLLHEFLSPLSNQRQDEFGGSFENRIRLVIRIAERLRSLLTDEQLLFTRISATDWVEGGWDLGQSVELARALKIAGVDLIDCSSGALVPVAKIPVAPNYQVPFAATILREAGIATGAVGLITEVEQANEIIAAHDADLIFLGRELLREPYWAHRAALALNAEPDWPLSYGYAVRRRPAKK
jgi:2,4-dienoyl-CoA reductase (NADPH2)